MKLKYKWQNLARITGGRLVEYQGDKYLEVKKGLLELGPDRVPAHVTRYHLRLPESLADKNVMLLDIENCGFPYTSPVNTITMGFVNGDVTTTTLFALDYHGERPIIRRCLDMLRNADAVITYNGRAFDIERLSRRMTTYGLFRKNEPTNLKDLLGDRHCDIFPIFQGLMQGTRRALLDHKLQTLEKVIFGVHRENDIEGAQIPTVYENFVYGPNVEGDAAEIIENVAKIIDHNSLDTLTLAAALEYLKEEGHTPELLVRMAGKTRERKPRIGPLRTNSEEVQACLRY